MRGGTGGRRAGGGGRRREEGGLAGNMGTAEAEGQVTKGCEWELRGAGDGRRRGSKCNAFGCGKWRDGTNKLFVSL